MLRVPLILIILLSLPMVSYIGYAGLHVMDGLMQECTPRTIALTLFPVRQVHTVPEMEWVFDETRLAEVRSSDSALADALAQGIIQVLEEPMMELAREGHCTEFEALGEQWNTAENRGV